jgi:hypothetical protein
MGLGPGKLGPSPPFHVRSCPGPRVAETGTNENRSNIVRPIFWWDSSSTLLLFTKHYYIIPYFKLRNLTLPYYFLSNGAKTRI